MNQLQIREGTVTMVLLIWFSGSYWHYLNKWSRLFGVAFDLDDRNIGHL